MARGSRVLGVAILGAVLGALPGGPVEGAPLSSDTCILALTPTNGQEVLPDLSDPGLDGVVTILLRHRLRPWQRRLLRRGSRGSFNGSGEPVSLLTHDLTRAPAAIVLSPETRSLILVPERPLSEAQYTLTIDRRLLWPSRRLQEWHRDIRTSFTVGPDVHPPRVREVTPAPNQMEVPPFTPVSIVFNESMDPKAVILGRSVFVEYAGLGPPLPVEGTLTLGDDGFLVQFTPDPCVGLPPATRIRIRLFGAGNAEAVADRVGNALEEDYAFEFWTKGEAPLPDPRLAPPPAQALYATTADTVVAFDIRGAIAEDGSFHPERIRQVLASEGYGGDFAVRLGSPGDAVVDPRTDPMTGHSFLYLVDEEAHDIALIDSGTGRVSRRVGGFQDPRGLGILGPEAPFAHSTLLVSDHAENSLTAVRIDDLPRSPQCEDPGQGTISWPPAREALPVGWDPSGVAATAIPSFGSLAMVAQYSEVFGGSATMVYGRGGSFAVQGSTSEGLHAPAEVAWSGMSCWLVGSPARDDTTGSVAIARLYLGRGFVFMAPQPSVVAVSSESIHDPGKPAVVPGSGRCLVPNRADGTVSELEEDGRASPRIRVVGVHPVGEWPTSVATDPTGRLAFVSLEGEGRIAVMDLADPGAVPYRIPLPGVRSVFTVTTQ